VTRVTRNDAASMQSCADLHQTLIGEDAMSSLADRQFFRAGKPLSRPSVSRFELWLWMALIALAAVMIAAAAAVSSYTDYVPSEAVFVGP
jgi:predicted lysophospholipase L1 biosynthesis ABC-type transport system permease subunit